MFTFKTPICSAAPFYVLLATSLLVACTKDSRDFEAGAAVADQALVNYSDKKILYINSYTRSYDWAEAITQGVERNLKRAGVEYSMVFLDTKENNDEAYIVQVAEKARDKIETYKPDLVIVSDDNAFKYIVAEYYKNHALPFVFCGINWDLSLYDAPYTNTTGIIEVALINKIVKNLAKYAKGDRIGVLMADTLSERKNIKYWQVESEQAFTRVEFSSTLEDWKEKFIQMQTEVDMLLLAEGKGIEGWGITDLVEFVEKHTRIPTGAESDSMSRLCLLSITKNASEQGDYVTECALKIFDGQSPDSIDIIKNKQGALHLNFRIADRLQVNFDPFLIKNAESIIQ